MRATNNKRVLHKRIGRGIIIRELRRIHRKLAQVENRQVRTETRVCRLATSLGVDIKL